MLDILPKSRWKRIRSSRNSVCISADLEELDWKKWVRDENFGSLCLQIPRKADGKLHRVYCRDARWPGIVQKRGGLCWEFPYRS